ncbi:MAG: hypothetical protein GTN69_11955 [Armatimonadetes bacterium]|nr:hypothetical protein [Armatimonadota bacterium]
MRSHMRIWVGIAVALGAVAILAAIALAAQSPDKGGQAPSVAPGMMGHQMMGMGAMHPGMMSAMAGRTSIAASDNAICVLSGNKLSKYDQNLKLLRQTEIQVDPGNAGMHRMMEGCYQIMSGNHHPGAPADPAAKSEHSQR